MLQTSGFPDFRAATIEGMVEMITSTERTIRALMEAPGYNEAASDFHLNRAMYRYGYVIIVQSNHLLLMAIDRNRAIQYTYFYALGPRVSIHSTHLLPTRLLEVCRNQVPSP